MPFIGIAIPPKPMLSLGMSDLTPAQNERLRRAMIAYRQKYCGDSVTELTAKLNEYGAIKQPSVSAFLNRNNGAAYKTANLFVRLLGKGTKLEDVIGPPEPQDGEDLSLMTAPFVPTRPSVLDQSAGTFLLKLSEQPGLKAWVHEHPAEVTIAELAQGIAAIESGQAAGYARVGDQQPHGGWGTFFRDLRGGKFSASRDRRGGGDAVAARAMELSALGGQAPSTIVIGGQAKAKRRKPAAEQKRGR